MKGNSQSPTSNRNDYTEIQRMRGETDKINKISRL